MEHGAFQWILDRIRENLRVIKEAPEAVVFLTLAVGALLYFSIDKLYNERFATMTNRIAFLDDRLRDYRERLSGATPEDAERKIASLAKKLDDAEKQINILKDPPRDPDILYQNGHAIAQTPPPQFNRAKSTISFDIITSSSEVNWLIPIRYRAWTLECAGRETTSMSFGMMRQINYQNVICNIKSKH
jgi:hypothetical protein